MRLNELVRTLLPEGGTVVDRTGSGHAWPPLLKVSDAAPTEPADDSLTAVTVGSDTADDELQGVLGAAAPGEGVLLLLPWPPHELPLGAVVQGLVSAGMQAVEAHPLADTAWGVAVVCRRVDDDVQAMHAYLDRKRAIAPLTGRTLLRLVDEHVVEGLVRRNGELRAKEAHRAFDAAMAKRDELAAERDAALKERDELAGELDRAREAARADQERLLQQLAEAKTRVQAVEDRVRGITGSRSYRLARTAARAARTPTRWLGNRQG
jgi:hypothetical protein